MCSKRCRTVELWYIELCKIVELKPECVTVWNYGNYINYMAELYKIINYIESIYWQN